MGRAAHLRQRPLRRVLRAGFNAARDRLWQIDTWRRRGLGTLSEVPGRPMWIKTKPLGYFCTEVICTANGLPTAMTPENH